MEDIAKAEKVNQLQQELKDVDNNIIIDWDFQQAQKGAAEVEKKANEVAATQIYLEGAYKRAKALIADDNALERSKKQKNNAVANKCMKPFIENGMPAELMKAILQTHDFSAASAGGQFKHSPAENDIAQEQEASFWETSRLFPSSNLSGHTEGFGVISQSPDLRVAIQETLVTHEAHSPSGARVDNTEFLNKVYAQGKWIPKSLGTFFGK